MIIIREKHISLTVVYAVLEPAKSSSSERVLSLFFHIEIKLQK